MLIVIVTEREEKRAESREQKEENESENEGREKEGRTREREKERREREPPVLRFITSPCVHSKGLRVYWQNARMCSTCARFADTHGDDLNVHTEA